MLIREVVILVLVGLFVFVFGFKFMKSLKGNDTAWSHVPKAERKKLIVYGIILAIAAVGLAYLAVTGIWSLQNQIR